MPVGKTPHFIACLLVTALSSVAAPTGAAIPRGPIDVLLAEGWTNDGFIDPTSGEAQRAQIAIAADGTPIAVWANRTVDQAPFQIVWSRFDGTHWSPAQLAFAPTPSHCQSPRLSHAADGSLWLAWYEFYDPPLNYSLFTDIRAARFVDGAWELLPPIGAQLMLPPPGTRWHAHPNFAIHGVSRDEAWVVFSGPLPGSTSLTAPTHLYGSRYLGGKLLPPVLVRRGGGIRVEMTSAPDGHPVTIYGVSDFGGPLVACAWDGASWVSTPGDSLHGVDVYEHAIQPDTSGAVRVVVTDTFDRTIYGSRRRIREYIRDASGFRPGPSLYETTERFTDAPEWRGLALATSLPCAPCSANEAADYRVFWVDCSFGASPRLMSLERKRTGIGGLDTPGEALFPATAWPQGAYDARSGRWHVVWTGPPTTTARRRAKFAWTQEYAGDMAIEGTLVGPDTVRITVACSGDATDREFRVFRLAWEDTLHAAPSAPPVPAAAVEVAASPVAGPCPFTIDDVVSDGRYVYFIELRSQVMLPAAFARSVEPIRVQSVEPPAPPLGPSATVFLAPYPQPAFGGSVTFPFDLAAPADDVRLVIHDSRGRAVRRYAMGALIGGSYSAGNAPRWDGRDDAGRRVAAGVYWSRLWVDDQAVGDARRVVFAP